jgi:hypothetical protein
MRPDDLYDLDTPPNMALKLLEVLYPNMFPKGTFS